MIEVRIERLAFGGDGVGRVDGQAVFVPLSAPGDLVRCSVVERRRRYLRAELVDLLEPGEGRCQPACPVFGRCGGCQWQHLSYPTQLAAKASLLDDILRRQLRLDDVCMLPPLHADRIWNYRSRVQFKCHALQERMAIGFYRRGSHYVEDIRQCPIADESINEVLPWLHRQLPRVARPDRIPQVDVEVADRGLPRLVVHDIAPPREDASAVLAKAAGKAGYSLFRQTGRKTTLENLAGETTLGIRVDIPPLWLGYGPGGFAQVHLEQNRKLIAAVLELANLEGTERVLDLFCGMGNLSLPLARRAARVVGVEAHDQSIRQAQQNAIENGIENARFVAQDAAGFLRRTKDRFDLVVLDPPRSGAREVVESLVTSSPQRILYVSCDPMTLARDLKPLIGRGYRMVNVCAADLFPQTYHLESVVLLEKR